MALTQLAIETPHKAPAPRAAQTGPAVTPKQREFIESLIAELGDAEGQVAVLRDSAVTLLNQGVLNRRTASQLIDALTQARADHRRKQHQAATAGLEEEGMCLCESRIYRVKRSEAGRLYALELVTENGASRFEYNRGAVFKLRPEHRMSVEQAAEHSRLIGACCVCGTTLTDPKSIARGIGPVCARRV
ncbi:DUF6011 domain-containing protein [Streptomyces milbemycinicus]|uniref:DUF6011 domain-containing protein n=1 Tax=Streptomyces milbemycinicus TaxID=476552 RepID=UPI000A36C403|nr:DUF6011 domain-containing protein [Streptomyces milbemycinicus]